MGIGDKVGDDGSIGVFEKICDLGFGSLVFKLVLTI